MLEIEVGGKCLGLMPQRAAWLPEERCLLVADAHIGKAVTFRSLGVPVPRGTTTQTLQRLSEAIAACGVARVVFLGDLLHSVRSLAPATLDAVVRWRRQYPALDLVLVRGNHDQRAGDPPPTLGVTVVDEPLPLGGLALCHHPRPQAGAYVLAGHLHPAVVLGGRAHQRLRLPCFHFGQDCGVLPAFGDFTGMHVVRPESGDRVFVVDGHGVQPLRTAPNPTLAA